jgi:hypothetical protein
MLLLLTEATLSGIDITGVSQDIMRAKIVRNRLKFCPNRAPTAHTMSLANKGRCRYDVVVVTDSWVVNGRLVRWPLSLDVAANWMGGEKSHIH